MRFVIEDKQKLIIDYVPFDWSLYNESQTKEKVLFLQLLKELCDTIQEPEHKGKGRKPIALADMIFSLCLKTYLDFSSRRVNSDIRLAVKAGYLQKSIHFNTLLKYFAHPYVNLILKQLIRISSLPLKQIEQDFAIDSTGFGNAVYVRWNDIRANYGAMQHGWRKCHVCTGVTTNIVTSIETTDAHSSDTTEFDWLVDSTAQHFSIREVSADKAYSSRHNLKHVSERGGIAYIPFKKNARPNPHGLGSTIWRRMFTYFHQHQEEFLQHYHKRSNVESTFSMIKKRFGSTVRTKNSISQDNEILCKVLCHNICVLIQEIFLNNLDVDLNLCAKTHLAHKWKH